MADINRIIHILQSTDEFRRGVFSIHIDEQGVFMRPTVGDRNYRLRNMDDVRARMDEMGISREDIWDATRPNQYPRTGPQRTRFLEEVAERAQEIHPGARVHRTAYRPTRQNVEEFEKIFKRDGKYYGLEVVDNEIATLLRVVTPERELERHEVRELLERTHGWSEADPLGGDKLAKRQKALLTARTHSMMMDNPLTVGVYDARLHAELGVDIRDLEAAFKADGLSGPKLEEALDDAARKATDGIAVGSRKAFRAFHDTLMQSVNSLRQEADEIQSSGGNLLEARELRRAAERMEEEAAHLAKMIQRGTGVYNFRGMGAVIKQLGTFKDDEATRAILQDPIGQFKGNIIMSTRDKVLKDLGVDIVADYRNLTPEFGLRSSAYFSIVPFRAEIEDQVRLDVQSLSSFGRNIFDLDKMEANMAAAITTEMNTLRKTGTLTPGIRQALEDSIERSESFPTPHTPLEAQQFRAAQQSASYARQVLSYAQDFNINENPQILRNVINSYIESLTRVKGGVRIPNYIVPDAVRAEVIPANAYRIARGKNAREVLPGQIRYDRSIHAFILHDSDATRLSPALGGFDFDDALNGMIRYNTATRQIKAIVYRQPNARGEIALLDMSFDDDAVNHLLHKKGVDMDQYRAVVRRRNEAARAIAKNQKDINSLTLTPEELGHRERAIAFWERELERHNTEIDGILRRNLELAPKDVLPRIGFDERGNFIGEKMIPDPADPRYGRLPGMDPEIRYRITSPDESAAKEAVKAQRRAAFEALTTDEQRHAFGGDEALERVRKIADDKGALGIWSNTRMYFDDWFERNAKAMRAAGLGELLQTAVIEQEQAIDAALAGVSGVNLREMATGVLERVSEMAARGVAAGIETARIDPALLNWKGGDEGAFARGLARANEALRQSGRVVTSKELLLKPDDPRATISRMLEGAKRYVAQAEELKAEMVAGALPDYIRNMELSGSQRITSDVRGLFDTYKQSARRYGNAANQLWDPTEAVLQGVELSRGEVRSAIHNDTLRYLTQFFDEDGKAGERVYRTMIRAAQVIQDSPHQSFYMLMQYGGEGEATVADLYRRSQGWALLQEAERLNDPLLADISRIRMGDPMTLDDVGRTLGTPIISRRNPRVMEYMADLLANDPLGRGITIQMVEDITKGVELAARDGVTTFEDAPELAQFFRGAGPGPVPMGALQAPLSPDLLMRIPGQPIIDAGVEVAEGVIPDRIDTLARVVGEAMRTGDPILDDAVRETVVRTYQGYISMTESTDPRIEALVQQPIRRRAAMSQGRGGDAEAVARVTRAIPEEPASTVWSRFGGETIQRLWNTRGGRAGMYASAAVLGAALVHSVRDREHTINDMQGPAFLPGGNPYSEENPYQYPAMAVPSQMRQSGSSGTTYSVRTQGADSNFVQEMASILDADVQMTNQNSRPRGRNSDRIYQEYR